MSLIFDFLILEIPKLVDRSASEPIEELPEVDDEEPVKRTDVKRNLKTSGPKIVDPYAESQSTSLLPILITVVAVLVPIVFCLCRL